MTDIDAVCEAVVREKNEEIERLTGLVRQTHREYVLIKASLVEAEAELNEARRTGIVSSGGKSQARHERRRAEIERDAALAELAAARPIVEAAREWFRAEHCFDSECAAGEHDRCPARVAEEALRALLEKML